MFELWASEKLKWVSWWEPWRCRQQSQCGTLFYGMVAMESIISLVFFSPSFRQKSVIVVMSKYCFSSTNVFYKRGCTAKEPSAEPPTEPWTCMNFHYLELSNERFQQDNWSNNWSPNCSRVETHTRAHAHTRSYVESNRETLSIDQKMGDIVCLCMSSYLHPVRCVVTHELDAATQCLLCHMSWSWLQS